MTKKEQAWLDIKTLKPFIGVLQMTVMAGNLRGEEKDFSFRKFRELADSVENMPKIHETEGQGLDAVAYLHYFSPSSDWYITEKDIDSDDLGQIQAFGLISLHGNYQELGYISIKELVEHRVELDLFWNRESIGAIKTRILKGE